MLAHNRSGHGTPIVFLHAFPLHREMWKENLDCLNPWTQPIAMDLPGFGHSPLEGDIALMDAMAQSVMETMDMMGINKRAVFVGISMGGYVLFQLARLFPKKIRALVLISTRCSADTDQARTNRFKNIAMVQKEGVEPLIPIMKPNLLGQTSLNSRPDLVARVEGLIRENEPLGVCAALRGMAQRPDSSAVLRAIKVPTLVLSGAEDAVVSPTEMELMAKEIHGMEFEIIPSAGHLLNMEQPEIFNRRLIDFLKTRVL